MTQKFSITGEDAQAIKRWNDKCNLLIAEYTLEYDKAKGELWRRISELTGIDPESGIWLLDASNSDVGVFIVTEGKPEKNKQLTKTRINLSNGGENVVKFPDVITPKEVELKLGDKDPIKFKPAKDPVEVKYKSNFGNDAFYPANETAMTFCALVNRKTITERDATFIKKLGYEIKVVNSDKKL